MLKIIGFKKPKKKGPDFQPSCQGHAWGECQERNDKCQHTACRLLISIAGRILSSDKANCLPNSL